MKTIKFNRNVNFIGRNGYFKQSGLVITRWFWDSDGIIDLAPLTSRGKEGQCHIEIPRENIRQLINALNALLTEEEQSCTN